MKLSENFLFLDQSMETIATFQCAAMIELEQAMYAVMEGDPTPTVDVCVTVRNGRVANSLTVLISVLPTSTATGQE